MSTNRLVIPLLVAAPILLVVGVVITLAAWLFDGLSQYNEAWATTLQYGIGFLIAAGAAVALLVIARRGKHRAGVIAGAILTGLAALVSGLPFAMSVAGLIYTGVLSLQAPTTEETTSMTEVRAQSQHLFEDLGLPDGDSNRTVSNCQLSNFDDGEQLWSFELFHLPPEDKDDALDSIEKQWTSLGYDVARSDDYLSINRQKLIYSARVSWHSDPGADVGNLTIDVTAICVVEN